MICLVLFLAVASSVMAAYSDSNSDANKVGPGGYGYGYSGSFSSGAGGGGGGGYPGYVPPPFPQFDFNNFLQQYFENIRKYHQQLAAHTLSYSAATSDPKNQAQAQTSLTLPNVNKGVQQGGGFGGYGFPGGFGAPGAGAAGGVPNFGGGAFSGNFGGGGQEGAAASAAIGPGGVHQTASVFPENPQNPNVDTRFGATPQDNGGGFYSVSTFSQSGSSNIDGKPSSFHQASTTVNDNGKVTTYTVKKP